MANFALFILLGILDVLALFALMFKTFRLPYFEYIKEIGIIAVITTLISYLIRVYFAAPAVLDIVLHLILYILFFRFLIKVKVWRAIIISLMYFGYGILSIASYLFYTKTGILNITLDPNGFDTYILQMTQIALAILFSLILYRFKLGFSFIVRPPHDFFIKKQLNKKEMMMIVGILILGAVTVAGASEFFDHTNLMPIPLNLLIFAIVIYLAHRRDKNGD